MNPLYVLDTDTATLLQGGHLSVSGQAYSRPADDVVVTVITVEEMLSGWYARIRKAKRPDELAHAYGKLAGAVHFLGGFTLLNFTVTAVDVFTDLHKRRLNIGANDLRIAAIALDVGATVVTRNVRDFRRVDELLVVDWSIF